jgi:outer membrane lipoprotein-sorting protein
LKADNNIKKLINDSHISVTPDTDEKILACALTEIKSRTKSSPHHPTTWRIIMKSKLTKLAVAAVIIIAIIVIINQFGVSVDIASVSWAAAVEQLSTTRTMTYTVTTHKQRDNLPNIAIQMDVAFMEPGHIRVDVMGGSLVWIVDQTLRKALVVKPLTKKFDEIDLPPNGVLMLPPARTVAQLTVLPDQPDEDIGEQNIEGRILRGYRVTQDGVIKSLWIDPKTMGLVRAEIDIADTPGLRLVITNFQFDVELEESLFSLAAPKGYTHEETSDGASTNE